MSGVVTFCAPVVKKLPPGKSTIVALITLSSMFIIVSLATSHWMEGCFELREFLQLLRKVDSMLYNKTMVAKRFDGPQKAIKGPQTCFSSGLFKYTVETTGFSTFLPHSNETNLLHATAALLIISLLSIIAGAALCVIGSHLDPRGSDGRDRFAGGMIMMAFGGICLFSAMVVFATLMKPATGTKPMVFFDQFEHGVMNLGKQKRSIVQLESKILKVEKAGKVHFQYSFYLGWIAFVFVLAALTFSCVIFMRKKHEDKSQIPLQ